MIKTFKCKETEGIYEGRLSRRLSQDIQRAAARKLEMLSAATRLESLKVPPGNKLEKLSGHRAGQYSIRINEQWRLCFVWKDGDTYDVEIVDYH
ncbi:MAG: type II toxin-antitoxin system RelE/ParE family toxin [Gammaproteobacteria bacterium]|nr:type II toxin-antitoxin system RelE/ParE family toxin [Gammaproteobacteria bacterium]